MSESSEPAYPTMMGPGMRWGLSKRDWFAGLVMQALVSNQEAMKLYYAGSDFNGALVPKLVSEHACIMADALLAELSKSGGAE